MLTRIADADDLRRRCPCAIGHRRDFRRFEAGGNRRPRPTGAGGLRERRFVIAQGLAGVRRRVCAQVGHGADADDLAARVAAFRTEIDDPVAGRDDVEIVLDDDERVTGEQQAAQRAQQLGDVLEVQPGGGFVEQKQRAPCDAEIGLRQVAGELESLRLATGQRRHRLPEAQVLEAHVGQWLQPGKHLALGGEERERLGHRQLQGRGDAEPLEQDLEHFRPVALAVAIHAAQVDVGQELHLDMLEAVAAAGGAAAVARIEAERARCVGALLRHRRRGVQLADRIEGADVACRVRARGLADRGLVDEHDLGHVLVSTQGAERARNLGGQPLGLAQRRIQHILDQR